MTESGWKKIESAPKDVWVEAGMYTAASPTRWWVCTATGEGVEEMKIKETATVVEVEDGIRLTQLLS